jgi:hypothetical protein
MIGNNIPPIINRKKNSGGVKEIKGEIKTTNTGRIRNK